MFLKIEAGQLTICINLGSDLSQAENVVKMFEQNAQVVQSDYNDLTLIKTKATIELGDSLTFKKESYGAPSAELIISADTEVVGAVNADANAFVDIKKIKADAAVEVAKYKKSAELARLEADAAMEKLEDALSKLEPTNS